MSLILDALKKLDREKASRRNGMPDLAVEVLRTDPAQSRKNTPLYLLAVSLTALAAVGITYAVIGKPGFLPKSPPPSPGISSESAKQVASASPGTGPRATPLAPLPVILPAPGKKDSPSPPAVDSSAKPSRPAPMAPPPSPKKGKAASLKSGALPKKPSAAPVSPPSAGRRVAAVPPKPAPSAKTSPGTSASRAGSLQRVSPAPPGSGVPAKPSSSAMAHTLESGQEISPSPLSPEPGRGVQSGAKPELSRVPLKTESRPPAASPGDKNGIPKGTSRETRVPPGKVSKPGEPAAGGSTQNPPPLKISGIVWNEDPSLRRAVINGSLVTEGSLIEGVKVVEIFATKVRFLHQNRYFEISVF
jgi:hypothetical protein